jgi:hypothetical protein
MSITDSLQLSGSPRSLEIAVPLVSFGFTFAGILLWQAGITISFQFFAIGCLIGSCILAYLAWIRPRKDIVALSTPLYAFIFFVVPTDYSAGVILQLLYAFSLTILLVRLKNRFGFAEPVPGSAAPDGPLERYVDLVQSSIVDMDPGFTHNAAVVFIRFVQGDYERAARLATSGNPVGSPRDGILFRAFAITAEQAAHTKTGGAAPPGFLRFLPEDAPLLFHPASPGDEEQEYTVSLENALLLLYAAGLACHDGEKKQALIYLRPFALKLSGLI